MTGTEPTEEPTGAYLDHAAASPLLPGVLEAMVPFLGAHFANPSAVYTEARRVRRAIDDARDSVAALCGCAPGELVFTSGGTEANNLAIRGAADACPGRIVVSAVEHDAVRRAGEALGAVVVGVDHDGAIDLGALADAVGDGTTVVSVIAVQSETGVISPLADVAAIVRSRAPAALLHTDAVQAARYFSLDEIARSFDLVSVSAHKLGGPKGVGALVVRDQAIGRLAPQLRGGGQERDLRAGTENVAGIVGFGAAARQSRPDRRPTAALRDHFEAGVLSKVGRATITAHGAPRSPAVSHIRFRGVAAEEMLVLLDERGVAASSGSACASGALDPSHVLLAMGWSAPEAREAVRFTLGPSTTPEEVEYAISAVADAVDRLAPADRP